MNAHLCDRSLGSGSEHRGRLVEPPLRSGFNTSPERQRGATPSLALGAGQKVLKPVLNQGLRIVSRWALLLLIAGYLLFAHFGCHGDEDNELFALLRTAAVGPSEVCKDRA